MSSTLGAWDSPAAAEGPAAASTTAAASASPVGRAGSRPRAGGRVVVAARTSSVGRTAAPTSVLALQSPLGPASPNPNNVSARPPPAALSARPQAGGKHQPVLLNLARAQSNSMIEAHKEGDAETTESKEPSNAAPANASLPSPSSLPGGRTPRGAPRSQRSNAAAAASASASAFAASSVLAVAGSAPGTDAAIPAPASPVAPTTNQGMKGSMRPSPPPPPAAASTAASGLSQLSLTGLQSPHVLSRVLSSTSIGSAAAAVAAPSTATSVLSASAASAPTNVIVSQSKDRAAALNTHMIAIRARESNLASSLTGYLQNQLSLFSKRGHAREVLHILEARQALVLSTQAAATSATANATAKESSSATSSNGSKGSSTLRRSLLAADGNSSITGSRSDLLKPPVSPSSARPLSAVSVNVASLSLGEEPPHPPQQQQLASSGSQGSLFLSRGSSRSRVPVGRAEVFAPLPVGSRAAIVPEQPPMVAPVPPSEPVPMIVYPEGSSNPFLPPLPVARLNLPSEHLRGVGPSRAAMDSLAAKAARQYAALAQQAIYLRDLEAKEDSALRSSFLGSAHSALVGVDTWSPPAWVRSSEDDGRDRWGRKFLAGLGSDVEKAVRFAHLAVNQGDPVPNAPALRSMLARYAAAVPRDYRPAVAAGSAGVGVGAERNAALDFDSLKGRRQWDPVLQLARREQAIKERANGAESPAAYASGSQSARGSRSGNPALPSAQTQALRLRLPAEAPSQATATNPPRPARSFRRNMHSLAYRLNDGSTTAAADAAAARGSQSARAQYQGYNSASNLSTAYSSNGSSAYGHPTAVIDQQAHPGLSAVAPSLPSQPLVSNLYATAGVTLSDLVQSQRDSHLYAGSFSATGGFQRLAAPSSRTAFLASSFASETDDAASHLLSAEEYEQHCAREQWRREMNEGALQILTSSPSHHSDPRIRALKQKQNEVLVTIVAPPAPAAAAADDGSLASLVDFSDRNGSTPLFHASWEGYTSILSLLCEFGANVNARNVRQHTAMDMAVERGHTDVVRILLRFGSDSTRAEGAAARKRCRARLGNNYAQWIKRMTLGGWMTEAGELLASNVKTGAPPPSDAESVYFTPLHRDLRAQDTSILRLFAHTVFWPQIVRPNLGAILAGSDEQQQDPEQDEWTIAGPRPVASFVPFQPPPLRHLTREARLARVAKLRQAREQEMQHKAEFRVAAGLEPAPQLPQPQHQRSLLLAAPPSATTPRGGQARRSSGSVTPRGSESKQQETAEAKEQEADAEDGPRAPYISILTILPRVRELGSSSERDEFEEGGSSSVDQYERDLNVVQSTLDKRGPEFYVENAQAVLALDAQRREAYTPLERWSDQLELYNAVLRGNLASVESLLAAHPEHAAFVAHGCTLLYHAAYHGFYSIARALLAAAAESKMEAAVLAAARRTTAGDNDEDSDAHHGGSALTDPVVVFDLSPDGQEKPTSERRVNYFHPLFTGTHAPVGIVDSARLNSTGVPLGCGSPALLDVNYLCVDELRSTEEHRADEQLRARFDTLAEHRRLRRALAEKRAARLRIKALEKSSRKALNISDSESSSDEEVDIAAAAAGTSNSSSAHASARSSGSLTKLHASATVPLTSAPRDAIVAPALSSSAARAAKLAAAQAQRDAADQAQLVVDAEIDAEFGLAPAVQLWHRWLIDPLGWNRLRQRKAREATAAARSEAVAIAVASGASNWDALEEDQRLGLYEARRERDREAAEDAAIAAAKDEAERQRRLDAVAPQRWETAIYVALKRKHYRLALLLHSQGAISPYSRQEILQMCDVQLRAREIMRTIRAANYPALQALLASACAAKPTGSRPGGAGLLAQVLSYQDASRGGHNPLLLCIGSNDLRAMELVRAATATQPGGAHMLHRLLAGIKDRLGYSAIDTSLLSAAASGGSSATGGAGLAGALALTDASTSSSIAMTSFLLNLGGLTLSTGTILDLVLNKHGAADGSESNAGTSASAAQQGVSVNYAGLEALKRIMVQTSLASAKSAAAQVAAESSSQSYLGGSRGRLVSPSALSAAAAAAAASKEKDVIDFPALFAALESNPHHLRPEQLADLREHLRAVEREHEFMKSQRAKAVAAARAELAAAAKSSGKRSSGSSKHSSSSSSPNLAARQLLSFPPRQADEDEMAAILEGVEADEYSPRGRFRGAGGGGEGFSFGHVAAGALGGSDDSELAEQTAALQRALSHLDAEDARKLATAQAQREKVEAIKASLASGVRIAGTTDAGAAAMAAADTDSSSDEDSKDEVSQALSAAKRASKRSSAATVAAPASSSSTTKGASASSSAFPVSPSSHPLTGATDTSGAVSSSSSDRDSDDDDGGTIPDWTKEIHEGSSRRASAQGSVATLGSNRASMGTSLSNPSSSSARNSTGAELPGTALRVDGSGSGAAVLAPSALKSKSSASAKQKKAATAKNLQFSTTGPAVLRPPVIQPLPASAAPVAASQEAPLDLLPLELKARLIWMLDSIQSSHTSGASTVDPQLLGVGVAARAARKDRVDPPSALEIVASMQAMQFPTDEPSRETKPLSLPTQQQRPGSGLLRVAAPNGRRGAHARTYSAAILPSFLGSPNAAPILPSADRPASPSSSSSSSTPAALIDVAMLKWANSLRINPHLSCLLGVDYPAEPARAHPPSAQELAAAIVTASLRNDGAEEGGGIGTVNQAASSRRVSQENTASSGTFITAVASSTSTSGSRRSATNTPTATSRSLAGFELRADPSLRTVTVDAWLESFQRLARSDPLGVQAVRDTIDEFERVSRVAEQELTRQRARKEAELAAESLRIAAHEQALHSRSIYARLSPFTPGVSGPTPHPPPSFLASRLAMYAFDDTSYSSSDEEDDAARLGTAVRREMRAPSPPHDATRAVGVSGSQVESAGVAATAVGGHASIFTFVPHLDPSGSGPPQQQQLQQPQATSALSPRLSSSEHPLAAFSGSVAAGHEKKSVRWRGSMSSERSSASSSSLVDREHANAAPDSAILSEQLRASMQRTAAGLLHERGLSGV